MGYVQIMSKVLVFPGIILEWSGIFVVKLSQITPCTLPSVHTKNKQNQEK